MNAVTVSVNVEGFVDQGEVGPDPYRVDRDGRPYVAVGDGGVVQGLRLGDSVFEHVGDHAAPGACLVHPSVEAGHALAALSCFGNAVIVRSGAAAGAVGRVLGQRGGGSRVIAVFAPHDLAQLRPGDRVSVTSRGQGSSGPLDGVNQMNVDPAAVALLSTSLREEKLHVSVRTTVASRVVGNGIGRPMASWDLDLQLESPAHGGVDLRLGDLVAVSDLDARYNAGFRRGFLSVGIVVHGSSPQPGHGPGLTVVWSGLAERFVVEEEPLTHQGITEEGLLSLGRED